ncbi:MAG: site-specific DNA-methyltransferase [Luteitalea sp.]|nr:site-specific DNA-methyltransferase [Luteitalea sp.]
MTTVTGAQALPFEDPVEGALDDSLRRFEWRGAPTQVESLQIAADDGRTIEVPSFINEFWTARQRAAHSLHEVSYRACFKPQLPRFFIERLTQPGDVVYDPFMGRGTTLVEAALMGRRAYGCDINPLSRVLCEPRLTPPTIAEVERALAEVNFEGCGAPATRRPSVVEERAPSAVDGLPEELLVFYHPDTLRQICALRQHLILKERSGTLSRADRWIRMVAVNRLTGHSPGFFSVYTLPPNQAVSPKSQAKINARLGQVPPMRDIRGIILHKSAALLRDCTTQARTVLEKAAPDHRFVVGSASDASTLAADSVALVVTSPPFLDVVDYKTDNWLRCWFCGIDVSSVRVTLSKQVDMWKQFVADVLRDVRRVLRPGGHVAFEVGEVRGGAVRLENAVIPAGIAAALEPVLLLINTQRFTKTANCWGVTNNRKGTNSNRVVVLRKHP